MLEAVMAHIHNYFSRERYDGIVTINAGQLEKPGLHAPYVAIDCGAVRGVYRLDGGQLQDVSGKTETPVDVSITADGTVWGLYPPAGFLRLVDEIRTYDEKNPAWAEARESFGDYSRTRAYASAGGIKTWVQIYHARLAPWCRPFTDVSL